MSDPSAPVVYSERLWVPVWYWVVGAVVASLIAAEVHIGTPSVPVWLPYLVLLPIAGWALLHLSRLRVDVTTPAGGETVLRVGRAKLPVSVVDRVAVVAPTAKSAALGRQLDPAAFVQHRTWVKTMVVVVLDDPDDPTPYWLVSTRNPERLAAALAPRP